MQTHEAVVVITVLAVDCGAVHGVVVHCDDPGMLGSLLWLVGSLQVLFQPSVLLPDQLQTIPDKEVELRVNGNDVSWTNIPAIYTQCHENLVVLHVAIYQS